MEQKPVSHHLHVLSPRHSLESVVWSHLTDRQKELLLRNNTRMPDAETYVQEFTSWEQPEVNCTDVQKADTS